MRYTTLEREKIMNTIDEMFMYIAELEDKVAMLQYKLENGEQSNE